MPKETVTIPESSKEYLKKSIDKLNRKAAKLGCELLVLTFDNEHVLEITHNPITNVEFFTPVKIPMVDATLEYEIPMVEGYELIAKLDFYGTANGGEVLVSAVPEKHVPAEYKNATSIKCDHCGWVRNRHHSVLLRHVETGEYKEVGSTCVKDFFGIDPMGFMFYAELDFAGWCGKASEEGYGGYGDGRYVWTYGIDEVLATTSAVIKNHGWCSKTAAYNNDLESTASLVWENLEPSRHTRKYRSHILVSVTEKDVELAEKTKEYFNSLPDDENNDYVINCKTLLRMEYVPSKYMGYACSMVNSYIRHLEKESERERKTAKYGPSNHVGEIGDRLKNVHVEVLFCREIDGYYGLSTLYTFRDADGNIYKTFYSGGSWSLEKGDFAYITGTVKKHDEWKDEKQTMLNRVAAKKTDKAIESGAFSKDEFAIA